MRLLILLSVTLLAACGDEPTPEEQGAEAARKMALVEKGNSALPPAEQVLPEPILYPDIERHSLAGSACNFAPGTSFATRVIAKPLDAYVKIGGEIVRFAADSGGLQLPLGTWSRYLSGTHELRLQLAEEGESVEGEGEYHGTVTLLDEHGRIVYEGSGLARCGG
jgi:hypothetical protein